MRKKKECLQSSIYGDENIKGDDKMIYQLALCDNEVALHEMICEELESAAMRCKIKIQTRTFTSGQDCIAYMAGGNAVDVLFLDIDMPDMDGIEVARRIREWDERQLIVFLTDHADYVFDTFEVQPFRFIRKSKMHMELFLALQAVRPVLERRRNRYLTLKTEDGMEQVAVSNIMYTEVLQRHMHFYLNDGREIVENKTMKKLLQELSYDEHFVLLDSGLLLNMEYERAYSQQSVTLKNGMVLPVARTRAKEVRRAIGRKRGRL